MRHQVSEHLDDVVCAKAAPNLDSQTFAREFVDHRQQPNAARRLTS